MYGLLGVVFGIQGIVFGFVASPLVALIFGIIGLIFGLKQGKMHKSGWSKSAITLSIISLIVGLIGIVVIYWVLNYIGSNPDLLAQLQAAQ